MGIIADDERSIRTFDRRSQAEEPDAASGDPQPGRGSSES